MLAFMQTDELQIFTTCISIHARHEVPLGQCDRYGCRHICTAVNRFKLEMWANAQCDGRPVEYRWHPLFNAAKFG